MSQAAKIIIADTPLRWQDVVAVARHGAVLELSGQAWARIDNAQAIVRQVVDSGERAYGISTGLGALCNVVLAGEQLSQLSRNTLLSHACGVGPALADEQTRAILCAAIINYSHGKSGIHRQVVEALLTLLNRGITPQVPSQGSVGYLTHMAHIGIALLGVGQVSYRGRVVSAEQALAEEGLQPVQLGAKDGLCLVNGTPCMTGLSCLALADASRLLQWADVIGAMSFEAQRGQIDAFDAQIIALKAHPGMQVVGSNLRALLDGSEVIAASRGIRTQDALSIRSIPQVHGAARDQLAHAVKQVETELNGATDNPLLLGTPDHYRVVSQANPHGQSVALAADPRVGLVHGGAREDRTALPEEMDFDLLWRSNRICTSMSVVRREAFDALGGFFDGGELIGAEDYSLWLRIAHAGWKVRACPMLVGHYTPAQGSLTSGIERCAAAEMFNARMLGDMLALPPAMVRWKIRAIRTDFARHLIHARRLRPARRLLAPALCERPTLERIGLMSVSCLPVQVLDARRRLRMRGRRLVHNP